MNGRYASESQRSVWVGVCVLLLVISLPAAAQVTRYVSPLSPSPTYPYTSWNTAARDIQTAVNACSGGETILVTNSFTYLLSTRINVGVGVTIRGVGYYKPLIHGNDNVPCFYLNNDYAVLDNLTISYGKGDGISWPNFGAGVAIDRGAVQNCDIHDNTASMKGGGVWIGSAGNGTVRNCRIYANEAESGGGVFLAGGGTVTNCDISGNNGRDLGGGVYVESQGTVVNCVITNNTCSGGVGLYSGGGAALSGFGALVNCVIRDNYAVVAGGGVYLGSGGQVVRCRIEYNHCGDAGGGVYLSGGGIVYGSTIQWNQTDNAGSDGGGAFIDAAGQIESCLIAQNVSFDLGGGVFMNGGLVKDCSVQQNLAAYWGGGINCDHGGTVLSCTIAGNHSDRAGGIHIWPGVYVYDSIIYGNTAYTSDPNWFRDGGAGIGGTFEYCCLSPIFSANGNFNADPRFVKPSTGFYDTAANYRLMWNSPCINAASPGSPDPSDKDADLKARMLRGHQDMGGYEFGCINNDFDADGKTDIGIFRPSTVTWYVFQSTEGPMAPFQFGTFGDLPVPGDYDSDGHSDLAIFRPSTVTWYVFGSRVGPLAPFQFGTFGDMPAPADYDGDGQSDLAIYRPSTMTWYVFGSSAGPIAPFVFGAPGDIPVPADYDGDGKADVAVFRPSTVTWYRYGTSAGAMPAFQFGTYGDLPMPGDYDGDGQVDVAIFRPSTVTWYIFGTSAGPFAPFQFGTFGDRPLRPFQ